MGFSAFIKEKFAGVDLNDHASLAALESGLLRLGEYVDEVVEDIHCTQVEFARAVAKHIRHTQKDNKAKEPAAPKGKGGRNAK